MQNITDSSDIAVGLLDTYDTTNHDTSSKPVNYSKPLSTTYYPMENSNPSEKNDSEIPLHRQASMGSMSSQRDRESLIKQTSIRAIRESKEPVKITWSNLSYNVTIPIVGTKET
jgi:hypothetical protein